MYMVSQLSLNVYGSHSVSVKPSNVQKHIAAGAKKVIVSAPSKDIPMFVKGVNFDCYKKSMNVVSNASCTTNCAAPLIHIMHKKFGVLGCLLTTAHSVTSSQHVHDGVNYVSPPYQTLSRETRGKGR